MRMYKNLKGKQVMITGAASGIGLATTKRFIAEGSRVVIIDWNREALDKTLTENPKLSEGVCGDVSDPDDIRS